MHSLQTRRTFLKRASLAAGTVGAWRYLPWVNIARGAESVDKVNCAVIGCGGRGMGHVATALGQNLVALADADEARLDKALSTAKDKKVDPTKIQTFTDYREMFDKIGKQIDAVFIATPNHQHAPPSMIAMQLGKGVYCEKPLSHSIAEARTLAEMAARYKVPTQMGNQGHNKDGYRRLCEYVWAGVIGNITETHSWTDRSNGGVGPRPASQQPPAKFHWDSWIGPAAYRDFHAELHPHEWHGWYDFGNGSLGNMGCHVLDGVHWALKLEHPTQIEAEQVFGGSDERYPTGTRIRWDFPARGDMPAVKAYWYDGRAGKGYSGDGIKASTRESDATTKPSKVKGNIPPLLAELKKKYPEEKFDSNGTLYVGEKGILYTSTYGSVMHLVPEKLMKETPEPEKTLPRPSEVAGDFLRAVRAGKPDTANGFEISAKLTEMVLLGNLAQHAGEGKPVEWDGANMTVTNLPELNQWVKREYRKGWTI